MYLGTGDTGAGGGFMGEMLLLSIRFSWTTSRSAFSVESAAGFEVVFGKEGASITGLAGVDSFADSVADAVARQCKYVRYSVASAESSACTMSREDIAKKLQLEQAKKLRKDSNKQT
jgi:hypothetical protein